jgi:hypothetical protein
LLREASKESGTEAASRNFHVFHEIKMRMVGGKQKKAKYMSMNITGTIGSTDI